MTTSQRAAIYARQSVSEDAGIEQQVKECSQEIRRRGWQEMATFTDNDVSGSKKRSAKTDWAKMLKAYDDGEFDVLVVTETSRLTRSLPDVLDVTMPRRQMRVIVKREGIDTDVDDYLLKQLVLLAEREVKLKTQRARVYAAERRKVGHPTAGRTPHGYDWVPAINRDSTGTRYAINKVEAADVRRIFAEFLGGGSLGQIARDLTTVGRLTRKGTKWHASSIRRVLLNPLYAGLLAPAQPTGQFNMASINLEECVPGAWEPIIGRDEITATRGRLIGVKANHQGTARKWLLSGLATCAACDTPVRSARGETHPTARKNGGKAPSKRYHAYRCPTGHFMRNGEIIDEFVAEVCIARMARSDVSDLVKLKTDQADIGILHAQRIELESRDEVIASMIASGRLKPKSAEQALDSLAAELRDVYVRIAQAVTRDPLAELAGVDDVRGWWEQATLARRRAIVDALMFVKIKSVGYGKRIKSVEACADTVEIEWKR